MSAFRIAVHRFLIDECLSIELAGITRRRGHHALHVTWADRAGYPDHALMPFILGGNYIFVTNNGADFRALYHAIDIHPGLVIILPNLRRTVQVVLFERVLNRVEEEGEIVNKLLTIDEPMAVTISDWPSPGRNR